MSIFFDLQGDSATLSEAESKSIHKSLRDALKAWTQERLEFSEQVENDGGPNIHGGIPFLFPLRLFVICLGSSE